MPDADVRVEMGEEDENDPEMYFTQAMKITHPHVDLQTPGGFFVRKIMAAAELTMRFEDNVAVVS